MTDLKDSAGKKYSDKEIEERIRIYDKTYLNINAAMLQQLLDDRNAVLKDLKALEAEVKYGLLNSFDIKHFQEMCDLTRSEKYEKGD